MNMLDKMITRYEATLPANKINLLTSLINYRYPMGKDSDDYIAELGANFNGLTNMEFAEVQGIHGKTLHSSAMIKEFQKIIGRVLKLKRAGR